MRDTAAAQGRSDSVGDSVKEKANEWIVVEEGRQVTHVTGYSEGVLTRNWIEALM